MYQARPVRFRFGPFEADLASQQLFHSGEIVPLQTKPFQFLAMLIQQHGQLVTRDQMSHALWPDIYVHVNQGLNAAVRKVRLALGDSVERPQYIETLGSKGYRFIHDVEVLHWSSEPTETSEPSIRIAVLPSAAESHLCFGISAEIISLLGRAHPQVRVIAPGSVSAFMRIGADLSSVPAALNARYVLMVQAERQDRRITTAARLLKASDWAEVWQGASEFPSGELSSAIEEITRQVVSTLRPEIPASALAPRVVKTNFRAYEEFLRGQQAWHRSSSANLRLAQKAYESSLQHDSEFAPALAGLANTLNLLASHGLVFPRKAHKRALEAAQTALELSPELPEAMTALAWALLSLQHDWAGATRLYEHVLRLNPSYSFAYLGLGNLLFSRGRVDEATAVIEKGCELDPLSSAMNAALSVAYFYARRYDDAIRRSKVTLELDPQSGIAHAALGAASLAQRRYSDALAEFEEAVQCTDREPVMEAKLAHAYAKSGKSSMAQSILRKLENGNRGLPQPAYHIALIHLELGDVNTAVRWLERACQERFERTLFIGIDPRLDVLRGTRRFQEMCKQVREPDPRRTASVRHIL